jgi:methylamine dehydrogenase accessory protein MauD
MAPIAALTIDDDSPQVGDLAPVVTGPTHDGRVLTIGGRSQAGQAVFLLFIGSDCPACKKIIPVAMIAARAAGYKLIFAAKGLAEDHLAMTRRYKMEGHDLLISAQATTAYQAAILPMGFVIRADGTIAAKGQVGSREQLESLLIVQPARTSTALSGARALLREGRAVAIRAQRNGRL